MANYKILVADPISPKGIQNLRDDPNMEHVEEWKGEKPPTDKELKDIIGDYDGVIVRSGAKLRDPAIFEAAKKLKVRPRGCWRRQH